MSLLTSIQRIGERINETLQSRDHFDLVQNVTINTISPLQKLPELLLDLWRHDIVWVELVRLGFLLHRISLRDLIGIVSSASRELLEEGAQERRVVVVLGSIGKVLGEVDNASLTQVAEKQSFIQPAY